MTPEQQDNSELLWELQKMAFGEFPQETMHQAQYNIEPEVRLIYAVLGEAVSTLVMAQASHWREVERVLKWVKSSREAWVFDFVCLCEALELSPSAVRAALRRKYPYAWRLQAAVRLLRVGRLGFQAVADQSGVRIEDVLVIARGFMPPRVVTAKARGLLRQPAEEVERERGGGMVEGGAQRSEAEGPQAPERSESAPTGTRPTPSERATDDPLDQGSWLIDPDEPVSHSMSQNCDPSDSEDLDLDH